MPWIRQAALSDTTGLYFENSYVEPFYMLGGEQEIPLSSNWVEETAGDTTWL